MEKCLRSHSFVFNEEDNGGESLVLTTEFYDNGDYAHGLNQGIFINQELTLNSYCNNATFNLVGVTLNPTILRQLADELEKAENEVVESLVNP